VILRPSDYDRWIERGIPEQPPIDRLRPYETDEMTGFWGAILPTPTTQKPVKPPSHPKTYKTRIIIGDKSFQKLA
jgi:hypothetical protein